MGFVSVSTQGRALSETGDCHRLLVSPLNWKRVPIGLYNDPTHNEMGRTRFQLSKKGGTRELQGWYWYRQHCLQLSYFLVTRVVVVVPPPAGLATSGDVTLQDTYSFLKLNKLVASSRAHSRNYHNWKRTPVNVSHLSSTTGREGVRFHVVSFHLNTTVKVVD